LQASIAFGKVGQTSKTTYTKRLAPRRRSPVTTPGPLRNEEILMNPQDDIDKDSTETSEWLDALKAVQAHRGTARTSWLVNRLVDEARTGGLYVPRSLNTAYKNTIPPEEEAKSTGDRAIEHKLRSIIRWNAMAIILRANKESSELGGHIASFQSAATLYDIGFGHFWHAATDQHGGDLLFIQGHSSPGIYARAFLEGRLTEDQLLGYRQETGGKGLSSYPHPWLMPDFWQFPTVSMGLGPLMAGAWPRPPSARSGPSWATARWTSPNRWARSPWPGVSGWTT